MNRTGRSPPRARSGVQRHVDAGDARARVLASTIALLRESGLSGAAIANVLEASGAPRGSLYYYFPHGKQQIVAEALATYRTEVRERFTAALAVRGTPGARVRSLFRMMAGRVESGGYRRSCAVGGVALDLDQDSDALRPLLDAIFSDWEDAIASSLPAPRSARTRAFARLVLTGLQGAYVRCRAAASSRPMRETGEWLAPIADTLR